MWSLAIAQGGGRGERSHRRRTKMTGRRKRRIKRGKSGRRRDSSAWGRRVDSARMSGWVRARVDTRASSPRRVSRKNSLFAQDNLTSSSPPLRPTADVPLPPEHPTDPPQRSPPLQTLLWSAESPARERSLPLPPPGALGEPSSHPVRRHFLLKRAAKKLQPQAFARCWGLTVLLVSTRWRPKRRSRPS